MSNSPLSRFPVLTDSAESENGSLVRCLRRHFSFISFLPEIDLLQCKSGLFHTKLNLKKKSSIRISEYHTVAIWSVGLLSF